MTKLPIVIAKDVKTYRKTCPASSSDALVKEVGPIPDHDLDAIDWSGCPLVWRDPDYCGGILTVCEHPRLPVEALIYNYLDGDTIETVADMFEVDVKLVRAIVQYYLDHARG
jgi:uncharacterized protein (DUF433 family)